jgi:hypothetical protein
VIKKSGSSAFNGNTDIDAEAPSGQAQKNSDLMHSVGIIRILEEQPASESIRYQQQITAKTASEALVTIVLKPSPEFVWI